MVTTILAPNASAMTLLGTNSYLLDCGDGQALVIDPGPPIESHAQAIRAEARARGLTIAAIALTHGHPDHASGAAAFAAATGARIYAHPTSRIPHDAELPLEGELHVGSIALRTIDAPGHAHDHAIFFLLEEGALFTGDVILGEGTSVVAPPGGAMRPYQRTLDRLAREFAGARTIFGGHGPPVSQPAAKIAEYIAHRRMREEQILAALSDEPATIPQLVRRIYSPQRQVLWPAMARQILAYLIALEDEGSVAARTLYRDFTAEEAAMLNPRIEEILNPADAAVVIAELGAELRLESLLEYRLTQGAA